MRRGWRDSRALRSFARAVYWLAVVVVAGVLVFLLLVFLESRDESSVGSVLPGPSVRST